MDAERIKQQLIDTARPYWEAEAEIPRRFVAGGPTREDFIRYLRCAVYKELNPAIGYAPPEGYACNLHEEFARLVDQFPRLHAGVDRQAIYQRLHMMTEEFNHYRVLADVLEFALGRPITDADVAQMPEDRKLNDMRRAHVESGDPCLVAAMGLTEGGGSRTFGELARTLAGKGEIEDRLAAAMEVIYSDEKAHYEDAAAEAASLVESEDDLARMTRAIDEVSLQRVRMRFEQFNEPMGWDEVESLIARTRAAIAA